MSHKVRQVKYVECDGCGYQLGERYTTLQLAYSESKSMHGKIEFHFHEASDEHDCLRYWITGHGIMERSLEPVQLITDRGRRVILSAVGAFREKSQV